MPGTHAKRIKTAGKLTTSASADPQREPTSSAVGKYASTELTNAQLEKILAADSPAGPAHPGAEDTLLLREQIAQTVNFDHMLVFGFPFTKASPDSSPQTLYLSATSKSAE